jgi:RNA polymerase sigma factor (sigma-70 family)
MSSSPEEDRRLLARFLSGDRSAAETLVRRFSNLVYRAVQHTLLTKHVPFEKHDLEDLHHTVFLQLFEQGHKKLRQFRGENGCSLASWIRLVAVRIVLNELRKKGVDSIARQQMQVPLEEISELKGTQEEASALMLKAEQEHLVKEGLKNLPPRYRLFVKLHFFQGLSLEDVAGAMQLSRENAYTIKHRAIQRLRELLVPAMNGKP